VHASRELIEAAGLMSYGPNFPDLYRRAGDYVDKIPRGAQPGERLDNEGEAVGQVISGSAVIA
jgi:hypothetical protein